MAYSPFHYTENINLSILKIKKLISFENYGIICPVEIFCLQMRIIMLNLFELSSQVLKEISGDLSHSFPESNSECIGLSSKKFKGC